MSKTVFLGAFALFAAQIVGAVPIVRSDVTVLGAADPVFNALIDQFRADLGGALNVPGPCAPAPCTTGRREVNWDAVPAGQTSPNNFSGSFFNGQNGVDPLGRQRGMGLSTPGTGFRVSATDFSVETSFGPDEFNAFSPARMFASMDSNITDVSFSLPGSPGVGATVSGFGVVFSDVDYTDSASLEFFDIAGQSLGLFGVEGVFPTANGSNSQGSFSFLGVTLDPGLRAARVRIVSGSRGINGDFQGLDDAVVMDDFIFAEPQAIPEPLTPALLAAGLLAAGLARRRQPAE